MTSVARSFAVVQGDDSESAQRFLVETVAGWRANGVKVAGVTAHRHGSPDRKCTAGILRDITSGDQFQIYLETAPSGTSCDLDAQGVDEACATVIDQIANSDVVALSKFGKLEAMWQGLFPAFEAAISAKRPVVTTVSAKHREAWKSFAPEATYIDADGGALAEWLALQA